MEANSSSHYKPWLHQQNHSSFSLIERGMEVAVPPARVSPRPSHHYANEAPPRPSSHQYTKPLPSIPLNIPLNQYWNQITMSWETPIHSEMTSSRRLTSIDTKLQTRITRTPRTSRRYSREGSTGFDPRFEMVCPEEYQQINQPRVDSPAPSSYSESIYDLYNPSETSLGVDKGDHSDYSGRIYNPQESYTAVVEEEESRWSSGDSSLIPDHADKGGLKPFYKLSEHMADAISSVTSLRHRDYPTKAQSKQISQHEIITLRGLLAEERTRHNKRITNYESNLENHYPHEQTDADILGPTPRPLVLRPKRKTQRLALDTNSDPLRNAHDPLERDIDDMISSLNQTKLYNTSTTLLFDEGNHFQKKAPPPLKPRKKLFGTGNHPLKSPFPFRQAPDVPDIVPETGPSERTFGRKLSGAMKHLSLSPISPKRSVISNSARRPSGPDTPMPNKSPFKGFFPSVESTMQKGGVNIQEAVSKAKTVHFKTPEERKRASLKKSIVYVGISDQGPGMASMYEC
ncbi:uncharacterized protein K444DRAFT_621014 [Hyaloscypha bicolor E]|uniref:Uncharacterized protein n=1 Tax=Hyaloscypha bicolor E TaxID=1095630 RepID=A0A2J6SMA1_9HELO|nr:uncharacterized protein K444DRAFT_621014 [Hyaloscypha bicolor E]PMD51888.1 hypothetical protein K444DRAFT_621014 [Hyaloscypha bicolor E]